MWRDATIKKKKKKKNRLYSPLLKLLGRDEVPLTPGHSWWYIEQRSPSLLCRFCGLICKWTDWIQGLPWSESLQLIYRPACLWALPGTWFIKSFVYHTLSLIAAPREGHFLWPASSTGFLFHFQHGKVVIPSQADACVCPVSVQEKGWKDREQWHHKLDARESGLHLPRPPIACHYRPFGTLFSCPWGSTALQDRKVCVCVGSGGWISDVVSFPLSTRYLQFHQG